MSISFNLDSLDAGRLKTLMRIKNSCLSCGVLLLLALFGLAPVSARACAACYGQSDSPLAAGMNWAILSLLGVIVAVLVSVAGFFVFLARRTAAAAPATITEGSRRRRIAAAADGSEKPAAAIFDRQCRPVTTHHARPSCSGANSDSGGRSAGKRRQH